MIFEDGNKQHNQARRRTDFYLHLIFIACTSFGIVCLTALIVDVVMDGVRALSPQFFTNFPSRRPAEAGLLSALVGTGYMVAIMAPVALVFGVGAAIYLEEYAPKNRLTRLIQVNISTLAGVPSIVYGILGLTLFVRAGGFEPLAMGRSIISGALTMALLVLPIIIVSAQESIRAVPRVRREASFALGANKWQTVQKAVLPSAIPGILTGVILSLSRAIGETAPLVMIGALTFVAFLPDDPFDQFTVIPIQIYNWIARPQLEFHELAAAGIMVLLTLLILMNLSAVLIRNKYQKKN